MHVSEKNYAEKHLLRMFLTEDEVLMEVKTLVKKYQCEVFNVVDFCSGVSLCRINFISVWLTTTLTRVSDAIMPLLSLSPLNV